MWPVRCQDPSGTSGTGFDIVVGGIWLSGIYAVDASV